MRMRMQMQTRMQMLVHYVRLRRASLILCAMYPAHVVKCMPDTRIDFDPQLSFAIAIQDSKAKAKAKGAEAEASARRLGATLTAPTSAATIARLFCETCESSTRRSPLYLFRDDSECYNLPDGDQQWSSSVYGEDTLLATCTHCATYYFLCPACSDAEYLEVSESAEDSRARNRAWAAERVAWESGFEHARRTLDRLVRGQLDGQPMPLPARLPSRRAVLCRFLGVSSWQIADDAVDLVCRKHVENLRANTAARECPFIHRRVFGANIHTDEFTQSIKDEEWGPCRGITGPDGGFYHNWHCEQCDKVWSGTDK